MSNLLKILLPLSLSILSVSAQAETVGEALKNCGQVQNSLKRLVCYDKIVNELNRYGGLQDLMDVPAPLSAKDKTDSEDENEADKNKRNSEFGLQPKLPEDTDEKIYATVVEVKEDGLKRAIFILNNGHHWRELEATNFKVKVGDVIYVESGALGSFHLSKDSLNRRIRVKRVK
ncbi:hypothetical protein [Aliiglaciecola lipolytica]|uniref:Type IV pilus assembly protein PilP n=1 Tax=Aliiglaciecola lipolytica E3 TaxID=1127673 RepID=K6YJC2_9ALTE|nr:hypothetical protein [Aliiglaciecola lipolytica]GAC16708.1 hypothetical protein GLIP_4097 [Aliiglaciecola lipolytica E3]